MILNHDHDGLTGSADANLSSFTHDCSKRPNSERRSTGLTPSGSDPFLHHGLSFGVV